MLYTIPVNKIAKLEKILKKYQKKTSSITYSIGEEVEEQGTLYIEDSRTHKMNSMPIKVKCKEVQVEGTYIINGWQFAGTIEFTELGNIIRLADSCFEGKVPLKYLHTPKICEHCGKIRNRKDTYLIYNVNSGEFKQVGSTCLLDYTRGLDANECASIMSCLDKFVSLSNKDCSYEDFFGANCYDSTGYGIDSKELKKHAISLVKAKGYKRMVNGCGTAQELSDFYFHFTYNDPSVWEEQYGSLELASDDEVKELDEYAQKTLDESKAYLETSYDSNVLYSYSASLSWLKSTIEYRDFSLLCSFIYKFLKERKAEELKQKRIAEVNNEHVGNINDRITIKIASYRLLYSNSIRVAYNSYASTYVYEFRDEQCHVYIWKSSKSIETRYDEESYELVHIKPLEIVATIKEHGEYNGVKQTIITRGKITKSEVIR